MNTEKLEKIKADLEQSRSWLQEIKNSKASIQFNYNKIFCVGMNKIGTEYTKAALIELGFPFAPQLPAEMMLKDWAEIRFDKLIDFCY
ncbi:hypothetical protein [Microcoleus sp. D3_18_C4]|uniref:hypothetical protein n=1 Tax=Microcoleus sp. D3_18_C4 TaxID=3055335 RepID=UPI002FD6AD86